MGLNIKDIENKIKIPEISKSMPVFSVKKASLDDRKKAIEIIGSKCRLGKLNHTIKFGNSLHFIYDNGVLQHYLPSGSIWARNIAADESFKDERRQWKTAKTIDEEDKENF